MCFAQLGSPQGVGAAGRGAGYSKSVLENGIRVVTESMPGVRSLALGIAVDVGLRHERRHQNGIAHLIEHLIFQGTSNRTANQVARDMDLTGGHIGGFTARDYTCYLATVLDEHGPYAMDLFGDLLLNPTFPEASLQRER